MLKFIVLFLIFFHFSRVWAAPDYANGVAITLDGKPHGEIKEAPFPDLWTTVMYAHDGKIGPGQAPVFILYGGTGGKISNFGMAVSMGALANSIRKNGGDFFAFQNPIYFNHHLSDSERMPVINRFKQAREQTDWMASTIAYVVSQIPRDEQGRLTRPVAVVTRSTGTFVAGQLLSDYYHSRNERAEVLKDVSYWPGPGVLDDKDPKLSEWLAREDKYLKSIKNPDGSGANDEIVRIVQRETMAGLTWTTLDPSRPILTDPGKKLPKVFFTAGAHDPNLDVLDQIRVMERFAKLHPALDITIFGMDTAHNPNASVSYEDKDGKPVNVKMLKRFKPILKRIFDEPQGGIYQSGLKYVAMEGFRNTQAFASCPILMEMFSER